jgi:IclR family KDG regulon transcriptional repressor
VTREVPAVGRALDILELFLSQPELSAPQIAQRTGLPRTTVHELLQTLTNRGYLHAEPGAPVRYRLGTRLCPLGAAVAQRLDLTEEATATARRLAAITGETAHVAVLEGTEVVYIAKQDSDQPVRMVSAVGRRLPAHCTAVGKVLLSALPPAALAARYPAERELPALTPRSVRTLSRLREHLATVRRDHVAYDDCEANDAVACVAAPVRDHSGAVVAALSVSVPTPRWSPARRAELTALVQQGAAELSLRLGGHGASAGD